ncbi:TIGR03016 family PEP-CTERM system-associated outer membrane protein [Thiohalorhabdus methylotrophus]|uniref:TIGR03016 family PEP-CTERM system-associated outer membrane protein n=1 Tax=Thiohalorhabdus methylotrophus TaxID=3242694 RepID=A0ABV4TUF9_9GAMM
MAFAVPGPAHGQTFSGGGRGSLFGETPLGDALDSGEGEEEQRRGQWVVEPRLTLGETITDNYSLAPPGEEEWDLVSQITPGIGIEGEGRRVQAYLDYQAQSLFYVRNPDTNGVFHQLDANGTGELLRNHLFLDASAAYTQQLISPAGTVPTSNLVPTANRTDVANFRVSPYAVQEFGSFANGQVRYTYDRTQYASGGLFDTESNAISGSLNSGRRFNELGWSLRYYREKEQLEELPDRTFERYSGELSYRLGAKTEIFGVGGYEDNDYETRQQGTDLSSDFWEGGLRYHPTRRTSLEGAFGERYFGNTWRVNLRHRAPDSEWFLRYTETVETTTQVQDDQLQFRLTDSSGNTITDEQGNPVIVEVPFSLQIQDVFLRKRLYGEVTAHTAKAQIRVSGYGESREYQRTGVEEEGYGAGAGMNWRIAPRTRAIGRISWDRHDLAFLGDRNDDIWRLGVRLARELRRKLTASLDYQYLRRDSNQPGVEYRQNSVSLLLTKVF